jgi:MFS family permease
MSAGLAIVTIGSYWGSYWVMFPGLLLWGLSMAFVFVAPQRAVMNSVLPRKRGEAGGIVMSSQLLGATIGMAVCSTLFSMTNSFHVVLSGATIFTLVVLVISWFSIETPGRHRAAPELQA